MAPTAPSPAPSFAATASLFVIVAVVIAAAAQTASAAGGCPKPCSCGSGFADSVLLSCSKKGLTSLAVLTAIGPSIATAIVEISLSNNLIAEIGPRAFEGVSQVKEVFLDHNRISSIAADAFSGLENLWTLSLHNNKITNLPPGVFADLKNIRYFDFYYNSITGLPAGLFAGLSYVETIRLHRNQITSVGSNAFACCDRLRTLILGSNRITSIAEDAFSAPERYRGFGTFCLAGNSLECCGDMTRLADLETNHPCGSNPLATCSSPPELRGKTLAQAVLSPDVPSCAPTNATSGEITCPSIATYSSRSTSSGALVGIILGTIIVYLVLVGAFGFLVVTPAVMRSVGRRSHPEHGQDLDHTEA